MLKKYGYSMYRRFAVILVAASCCILFAEAVLGAPQRVLSSVVFDDDGSQLILWEEELPGIPAAFFVVKRASGTKTEKVIWLSYVQQWKGLMPSETWLADIALIPRSREAFVVLVRSVNINIWISVYRINLYGDVAEFPLAFDPEDKSLWPEPSEPLDPNYKYQGTLRATCVDNLERIGLIYQRDGLVIFGERDKAKCSPVYLGLDFRSGQWSQLRFESVESEEP